MQDEQDDVRDTSQPANKKHKGGVVQTFPAWMQVLPASHTHQHLPMSVLVKHTCSSLSHSFCTQARSRQQTPPVKKVENSRAVRIETGTQADFMAFRLNTTNSPLVVQRKPRVWNTPGLSKNTSHGPLVVQCKPRIWSTSGRSKNTESEAQAQAGGTPLPRASNSQSLEQAKQAGVQEQDPKQQEPEHHLALQGQAQTQEPQTSNSGHDSEAPKTTEGGLSVLDPSRLVQQVLDWLVQAGHIHDGSVQVRDFMVYAVAFSMANPHDVLPILLKDNAHMVAGRSQEVTLEVTTKSLWLVPGPDVDSEVVCAALAGVQHLLGQGAQVLKKGSCLPYVAGSKAAQGTDSKHQPLETCSIPDPISVVLQVCSLCAGVPITLRDIGDPTSPDQGAVYAEYKFPYSSDLSLQYTRTSHCQDGSMGIVYGCGDNSEPTEQDGCNIIMTCTGGQSEFLQFEAVIPKAQYVQAQSVAGSSRYENHSRAGPTGISEC